jgi:protoporphyrinogen oxidase
MKIVKLSQKNPWAADASNLHPAEQYTYDEIPYALKRLNEATEWVRLNEEPQDHELVKAAFEKYGLTEQVARSFQNIVESVTKELKSIS